MVEKRCKKIWTKMLVVLIGLAMFFTGLPYVIPITTADSSLTSPFDNGFIKKTDGILLHARFWPANGEPKANVVLIHGMGGSVFSWRYTAPALAEAGYAVLAVDLPGFGYSDRQRGVDHSQQNRARLVWMLLDGISSDSLYPTAPGGWIPVGHSMGGGTAFQMAIDRPEQTRALVLVAGAVLSGGNPVGGFTRFAPLDRWVSVIARHLLFRKERIEDFLSSAYGRAPTSDEVLGYLEPLMMNGAEGILSDLIMHASSPDVDALKGSNVKIFAIWGEKDDWVPLEDAYRLQEKIESLQLQVIREAYHCPMETHAEEFFRIIERMLQSVS